MRNRIREIYPGRNSGGRCRGCAPLSSTSVAVQTVCARSCGVWAASPRFPSGRAICLAQSGPERSRQTTLRCTAVCSNKPRRARAGRLVARAVAVGRGGRDANPFRMASNVSAMARASKLTMAIVFLRICVSSASEISFSLRAKNAVPRRACSNAACGAASAS